MAFFVSGQVFSQNGKYKKNQKETKKTTTNLQGRQTGEVPTGVQTNSNLIWSENFSTANTNTGDQGTKAETKNWTLTQLSQAGDQPNLWFISSTEAGTPLNSCRRGFLEDNSNLNNTLHVGFQNAGIPINGLKEDFGAKYHNTSISYCDWRIESQDINISGKDNISLSFDYFYCGNGQEDILQVWYTNTDGNWQMLQQLTPTQPSPICDQNSPKPIWGKFEAMSLQGTEEASIIKIAFRWMNTGSDPDNVNERWSCAIDNISVFGESVAPVNSGDPFLRASSINNNQSVNPSPFWTEDFGTSDKNGNQGQLAEGSWETIKGEDNGQKANSWYISAMESGQVQGNCSKSFLDDNTLFNNTLHISYKDDNGRSDLAAKYWKNESSATNIKVQSPIIDCSGKSNINLSFDYFSGGVLGSDFLSLHYFDGSNWNLLTNFGPSPTNTICNGGAFWSNSGNIQLPTSCDNNPEVRIAFKWQNPSSVAGNTNGISTAIDNISIFGDTMTVTSGPTQLKNVDKITISSKIVNNKTEIDFSSKKGNSFDIEKSEDGVSFTKISNLNSNKSGQYSYIDYSSKEGISYYRVISKSGKLQTISQTVISEVSPERKINFTIYPNPNSGQFTVDFGGIENNFQVDLFLLDENGLKIYETQFELHSLLNNKLDVIPNNLLKNGRYYCTLAIEGIKYTSIVIVK